MCIILFQQQCNLLSIINRRGRSMLCAGECLYTKITVLKVSHIIYIRKSTPIKSNIHTIQKNQISKETFSHSADNSNKKLVTNFFFFLLAHAFNATRALQSSGHKRIIRRLIRRRDLMKRFIHCLRSGGR